MQRVNHRRVGRVGDIGFLAVVEKLPSQTPTPLAFLGVGADEKPSAAKPMTDDEHLDEEPAMGEK